MAKLRDLALESSQKMTSSSVFLKSYNRGIPPGFPQASLEDLKQFQKLYPGLFKDGGKWSLEKHRKRLLDWLPRHNK